MIQVGAARHEHTGSTAPGYVRGPTRRRTDYSGADSLNAAPLPSDSVLIPPGLDAVMGTVRQDLDGPAAAGPPDLPSSLATTLTAFASSGVILAMRPDEARSPECQGAMRTWGSAHPSTP